MTAQTMITLNDLAAPGLWAPVFGREAPLELEIGFGWDPFLLEEAARRPDTDFVGLEYDRQRVQAFARKAAARGIPNVRVVHGEALYCLPRLFVPGQLRRTCIHFPDPWHKKKQQKHRLLGPWFLKVLFHHTVEGGSLVVGTDSAVYRDFIAESLGAVQGLQNLGAPAAWADRLPGHPMTKFERLFRSQGKPIYYFHYARAEAFAPAHGPEVEAARAKIPRRITEMPHVVFTEKLGLADFYAGFQPWEWRQEEVICKVTEAWLASRGSSLLLEAVLIQEGHDELFYVEISAKNKGTVVRISPLREVERNELLFRFLAGLTKRLQEAFPQATLSYHNLGNYLQSER
jgi:tRNA (guanine-N7-)-methyltransferase